MVGGALAGIVAGALAPSALLQSANIATSASMNAMEEADIDVAFRGSQRKLGSAATRLDWT
jgi:hypothetical protein